ncbi:S-layer homology domain-containing protein [Paenibacillus sp. CAU 1782]
MKKMLLSCMAFVLLSVLWATPAFASFKDVDGNARYAWAKASIDEMNARGVLTGYPDGTFKPADAVTKAQFTVMIYRLFPLLRHPDPVAIPGVPANHWASKEFAELYSTIWPIYAADEQDFNDESDYSYKPDKKMTRWEVMMTLDALFADVDAPELYDLSTQDLMKELSRIKDVAFVKHASYDAFEAQVKAISLMHPKLELAYADGELEYATDLDYVKGAALYRYTKLGIMTPDASGKFYPDRTVTRAETVTILNRLLAIAGEDYAYEEEEEQLSGYFLTGTGGELGFGGTLQSGNVYSNIVLQEAPEWYDNVGAVLEQVSMRIKSDYAMDVYVTINDQTTKYNYEQFSNNNRVIIDVAGVKTFFVEGKPRFPEQLDEDGYYPVMIYVGDPEAPVYEDDDEWYANEF